MVAQVLDIDARTPKVTASVHAVLLALREQFPNALWNLACGLEQSECILTIFVDGANAWRVRESVANLLELSRSGDGVSLVVVVQPLAAASVHGVQSYPI